MGPNLVTKSFFIVPELNEHVLVLFEKQQMQQPHDELTTLIGGVYGWKICGRKPSLFAGI